MPNKSISILAGNPKVEFVSPEEIYIEPQTGAFEEAMKIVKETRAEVLKISILFDHPGIFKKQFVDPSLKFKSKKQRKRALEHLKLSNLHPLIRDNYSVIAADYGISLKDISVVSEDLCRTFIMDRNLTGRIYRMCYSPKKQCGCRGPCPTGDSDYKEEYRVNCTGITAGSIYYMAKGLPEDTKLITCLEQDPIRVKPLTIAMGTERAIRIFNLKNIIEQRMLVPLKDGSYHIKVTAFTPDSQLFT